MNRTTRTRLTGWAVFGVVAVGLMLALRYTDLRPWVCAVIAFLAGTVAEQLYRATRR